LKTTLKRLEKTLRCREQLAEGLHMIDFEQLKIENQTLSEKIEERNEELSKLKRKKTTTVQILTHIREKLRSIEKQNILISQELIQIDHEIISNRNEVTMTKHSRDVCIKNNIELKRQRGFATNNLLILDYEIRKQTIEMLQHSIHELQERHFLLTKQITTNKLKLTQHGAATLGGGVDVGTSGNFKSMTGSRTSFDHGNEGGTAAAAAAGEGDRIALPPIGKKEGGKYLTSGGMTGGYKGKMRK
jgi:hypothetical protein